VPCRYKELEHTEDLIRNFKQGGSATHSTIIDMKAVSGKPQYKGWLVQMGRGARLNDRSWIPGVFFGEKYLLAGDRHFPGSVSQVSRHDFRPTFTVQAILVRIRRWKDFFGDQFELVREFDLHDITTWPQAPTAHLERTNRWQGARHVMIGATFKRRGELIRIAHFYVM